MNEKELDIVFNRISDKYNSVAEAVLESKELSKETKRYLNKMIDDFGLADADERIWIAIQNASFIVSYKAEFTLEEFIDDVALNLSNSDVFY